ncbi:hypothetical protein DPMN_131334 [Dreissena polymorpha]|uniref:Uncharacterized protein n=1 Tax=Dreissena polymorpha TaxID=45954 RepID=A0A9D4K2A9_DREPO|nr:hypothetical protein DPMN_131334 [Dreissena polymorpha]
MRPGPLRAASAAEILAFSKLASSPLHGQVAPQGRGFADLAWVARLAPYCGLLLRGLTERLRRVWVALADLGLSALPYETSEAPEVPRLSANAYGGGPRLVGRPVARIKKFFSPIYIGMFSSSAVLHFTYCTLPAVLSTVSGDQISVLRSTASGKYADNFTEPNSVENFYVQESLGTRALRFLADSCGKIRSESCGTRGPAQSRTRPAGRGRLPRPRPRETVRKGQGHGVPLVETRLPRPRPREMVRKARDTGGPLVPYETASRRPPSETPAARDGPQGRDTGSR